MNFDSYQSHQTPPPKSGNCRRQNTWLGSKPQLKGQPAKDARRRRMEFRQIRSVSKTKSAADTSTSENDDVCLKDGTDETQTEATEGSPENGAVTGGGMRCRPYGKITVVGRRREMEDIVAVELGFLKRGDESYDLFGVYHGHGRRVAHACGQTLHKMLAEIVDAEGSSKEIDWEKVMAAGFNMMEAEVNRKGTVGAASKAVVALVGKNEAVVAANSGGARAVLSRGETAVQLLEESIDGASARAKVEAGGKVRVIRRSEADELLILGSEGLWEVISTEVACQIARSYCHGGNSSGQKDAAAAAAAAVMAELALARGSRANISIIVVHMKPT